MVRAAKREQLRKDRNIMYSRVEMLADDKPSPKNMEVLAEACQSDESLEIVFDDIEKYLSDNNKDDLPKQL